MVDILYFVVTMNLLLFIAYLTNKNNILKDELKKKNVEPYDNALYNGIINTNSELAKTRGRLSQTQLLLKMSEQERLAKQENLYNDNNDIYTRPN